MARKHLRADGELTGPHSVPDGGIPVETTVKCCASIYPGPRVPLPDDFVVQVKSLELLLDMPIILCVQNDPECEFGNIDGRLLEAFRNLRSDLDQGSQVALLIDSPGGQADCAYKVANILRRHCGGFSAVVPQYAKSAATLLALGAKTMILGEYAELGPLDVQVPDREADGVPYRSALDEVQAIERLRAEAWSALDEAVLLLLGRTRKTIGSIMPSAIEYTTEIMRPLFEKVDVVQYTRMSRLLKIGEAYAVRLLQPKYSEAVARGIADKLVRNYPTHGFYIDADETEAIGLKTTRASVEMNHIFDEMCPYLNDLTVVGRIVEVSE